MGSRPKTSTPRPKSNVDGWNWFITSKRYLGRSHRGLPLTAIVAGHQWTPVVPATTPSRTLPVNYAYKSTEHPFPLSIKSSCTCICTSNICSTLQPAISKNQTSHRYCTKLTRERGRGDGGNLGKRNGRSLVLGRCKLIDNPGLSPTPTLAEQVGC